jgi:transcriptional regulator with XRE-family HTH domain
VRAFRIARGMSQTALGEKVGVTFQQIQKYENGINRIGGSRLRKIAGVLGVAIGALFGEDDKSDAATDHLLTGALARAYAARLLTAFDGIDDLSQRRALVEFIETMAHGPKLSRGAPASEGRRKLQ